MDLTATSCIREASHTEKVALAGPSMHGSIGIARQPPTTLYGSTIFMPPSNSLAEPAIYSGAIRHGLSQTVSVLVMAVPLPCQCTTCTNTTRQETTLLVLSRVTAVWSSWSSHYKSFADNAGRKIGRIRYFFW